ncbi:MAG: hypothetical protein QM647_02485 [Asticcacaulis sp.]|uniref:hypothetical protein n=1 Tax=Asticcacaulis sp. TaxID=1872648 RepID=UPI0039E568B5
MKTLLLLFALILSLTSSAFAEGKRFYYKDFSGEESLVFDYQDHIMFRSDKYFSNPGVDYIGSDLNDCSTLEFLCVSFSGMTIAVPSDGNIQNNWSCNDTAFTVLYERMIDMHVQKFIKSENSKGIAFFSYSQEFGIDSISMYFDKTSYKAKTFFAVNGYGLLSNEGFSGRK